MRGRKPTPTAFKIVTGNPGRRPLNDREPTSRAIRPKAPAHLNAAAKKIWKRLVNELFNLQLITTLDIEMLAAFCAAAARTAKMEKIIEQTGEVIKCKVTGKLVTSPYVAVLRSSLRAMQSFGSEFGLSAAARTRLKVPDSAPADPMEQLLNEAQ